MPNMVHTARILSLLAVLGVTEGFTFSALRCSALSSCSFSSSACRSTTLSSADLSSSKLRCLSPSALRIRGARLSPGLRMSGSDTDKEAKLALARKLAEEAQKALDDAKKSEAKANSFRPQNKTQVFDTRAEIRTRQLLGSFSDVVYQSWGSVMNGKPGDADPLGLKERRSLTPESEKQTVKALFDQIDADGSGEIDQAELEAWVREVISYQADESQIKSMLEEVDVNNDNLIQFEEFEAMASSFMSKAEADSMSSAQRALEQD
mmetsp:Transcript_9409/g.14827  ORF Transcript_9409/g.14827 Transcript_9409/m.14827 type:complete len:264 (-) Transcript_9409:1313-2104(-)